ncbi:MAG: bifunctional YncE family protein/alkaline phosphatase family protein [Bacteroidetes bacterium]|nr:bifunctional YncE family protein/alkaline phosphatase family protein [Bacteroidota bacterium]
MNKVLPFLFISTLAQAQIQYEVSPPSGNLPAMANKNNISVLPNGRFITPMGRQFITAPHPYGLTLSKDGTVAITSNSGINPFSISIIKGLNVANPKVIQVPEGAKTDNGILEACFMGLAINKTNTIVYVSGGETNKIHLFNINSGKKLGTIDCAVKNAKVDYSHGYLGDMVMSADEKFLFVVDQINFRIVVIDLLSKRIVDNIPTGRYPFGIALTPNQKNLVVANVGVFEYSPFTDIDKNNLKNTAHKWPSSIYGSKEMIEGNPSEGVKPLGDPNADEAFSVWTYDITKYTQKTAVNPAQNIKKVKTGFLVGQKIEDFEAVGGSSPNSLVATNDKIYVSNGNNDCISIIDIASGKLDQNLMLNPEPRLGKFRGLIPFGVAISPDQSRLFVALAGINAVAVIDTKDQSIKGYIPTAWFPSKLKVTPDGKKLVIANAKGYGSGPNGGATFKIGQEGSYIGSLMKGVVSYMDIPGDLELKTLTQKVIDNNFKFTPIDQVSSEAGKVIPAKPLTGSENIKHIVFISKENRTYDEVFGQLKDGDGEAELARFGLNRTVKNRSMDSVVRHADVMPNHHALAKRFAISDNFFCDSDVSADGHRWLASTYPNEWVETNTAASYGGRKGMREESNAPGNWSIYGSAGSIYPEDYNEAGSLWDHMERNNKDLFNFGFGVEMAGAFSDSTMKYTGELYTINYPIAAPLFNKSSRTFPTYNMAIPDQFRADEFIREFKEKWSNGNLPSLITLQLPNDHGSKERPAAGWPFQESYMADNDLALGRTIEFLSNTPYWKNMMIVVTEDDPQGGVDHVDAHRSLLMVMSPYAKKNYVGHVHYSFGSIFKTFWKVFGIPYLNQYDVSATDLSDLFTNEPDFSPYRAVPADIRIFDPQKALDPFDEKFDWKAFNESEELDKTETMQKRRAEDDKHEKNN